MYIPKTVYGTELTLEDCQMQVGKGWHDLVEECYNLCALYEVNISQVKEKFGTLRFYIWGGTDELFDKIEDICARSANICEFCGEKGEPKQITGWWKTVCNDCYEKEMQHIERVQKRLHQRNSQ